MGKVTGYQGCTCGRCLMAGGFCRPGLAIDPPPPLLPDPPPLLLDPPPLLPDPPLRRPKRPPERPPSRPKEGRVSDGRGPPSVVAPSPEADMSSKRNRADDVSISSPGVIPRSPAMPPRRPARLLRCPPRMPVPVESSTCMYPSSMLCRYPILPCSSTLPLVVPWILRKVSKRSRTDQAAPLLCPWKTPVGGGAANKINASAVPIYAEFSTETESICRSCDSSKTTAPRGYLVYSLAPPASNSS
jgi:hypothetical protein